MIDPRPILVTGGAGFIGSHIRMTLAQAGYPVRCLDLIEPRPVLDGEEIHIGSVTDADDSAAAVNGCSGVIHGAALAQLWHSDLETYERINVEGTGYVLDAAALAGVPVVYISSFTTLVGRDTCSGDVLTESSVLPPEALLGPYPKSKRRAELLVQSAAADGLHTVIVLPTAPVGPGDRSLTPPTVMIRDLAAGRTPALIDCLLNLVDVQMLARAIVAALFKGKAGERYLLCGEDILLRDLAAKVAALTGRNPPKITIPMSIALTAARLEAGLSAFSGHAPAAPLTGVRLAARKVRLNGTKAAVELGFDPPPFDTALSASVAWMRAEGLLPESNKHAISRT